MCHQKGENYSRDPNQSLFFLSFVSFLKDKSGFTVLYIYFNKSCEKNKTTAGLFLSLTSLTCLSNFSSNSSEMQIFSSEMSKIHSFIPTKFPKTVGIVDSWSKLLKKK